MSGTAKYSSADLSVTFSATMEQADYGVPGSPTWWEPDPDSIEIVDLEIAGVEVEPADLPKHLVDAILALSDGLDWEDD